MYQLSTKGRYGTRLMYQLAKNHGKGPMLLKDIARIENLSIKYMEQIIPLLKKAGLIKSLRGPYGGYGLQKPPEAINMKVILIALEGDISPVHCVDEPESCDRSKFCPARQVWHIMEEQLNDTLSKITLQDMLKMGKDEGEGLDERLTE